MKPTALTLACAGCGWAAPPPEEVRYPFRCPKAGRGDHHWGVMTREGFGRPAAK